MANRDQQPDSERIHQSLLTLSEEVPQFRNIPAFNTGDAILRSLEQLNSKLDAFIQQTNHRFEQVNRRFDQIETKIDGLHTRIMASDHNSTARVQNAYLMRPSDRLFALVNPSTTAAIEGFPEMSRDIRAMQTATLNSVLRDLGLPTPGGREEKEKRLRQYIGLHPQPEHI